MATSRGTAGDLIPVLASFFALQPPFPLSDSAGADVSFDWRFSLEHPLLVAHGTCPEGALPPFIEFAGCTEHKTKSKSTSTLTETGLARARAL